MYAWFHHDVVFDLCTSEVTRGFAIEPIFDFIGVASLMYQDYRAVVCIRTYIQSVRR